MRVLFDTNVLVAAMIKSHSDHRVCRLWLAAVGQGTCEGFYSLHSLAETFAILTRAPLAAGHPLDIDTAFALVKINLALLAGVSLDQGDYWQVIERMRRLKLPGAAIYDAIHGQAALKVNAEVLLSLNEKHFARLGSDVGLLVRNPRNDAPSSKL